MQFHYIYITTNNIDGKRYIGKRTYTGTDIKNDTYLGSGKYFKNAVKKYGKKNFTKVILQVCETEDEAYEAETWWVYISNANHLDAFYNIANGGKGGRKGLDPWNKGKKMSDEYCEKCRVRATGVKQTEETRIKKSNAMKGKFDGENNYWYSKHQSEESNRKRSQSLKGRFAGENNPMYGKHQSEESNRKRSEALKGVPKGERSEEYRKNMSDAQHKVVVVCLDKNSGEIVKIYESAISVRKDGFDDGKVIACCKHRPHRNNHKGYKWMYLDEYNKINNKE